MSENNTTSSLSNSVDNQSWEHVLETVSPEVQFLNRDWYDVWGRDYAANDSEHSPVTYASSVIYEGKYHRLDSIFPYVLRGYRGLQVLSMAGYYYPFRKFLCHPDAQDVAIDCFTESVHENTNALVVNIGPVQKSDAVDTLLKSSFQRRNWRFSEVSAGIQQMVSLPATSELFFASLSKNMRKSYGRRMRALEAMGQLEIIHYNKCTPTLWDKAVDECAEVESRSWLASDPDGKTRVYGSESFWKSYVRCDDGSKRVTISVVSLDTKPIAYSLSLDSGICRYSISGQYDQEYKQYGVGIIADMSMFENAIGYGIETVNMGDGEAAYKLRWGAQPGTELQSFYAFRPGIVGWLAHTAFVSLNKIRKTSIGYWLNHYF